jgi:hypothetical protein
VALSNKPLKRRVFIMSDTDVKSLLSKTATSRESGINAATLLGELIKTPQLVMIRNHTKEAAPAVGSASPNAAGAVDPLAR